MKKPKMILFDYGQTLANELDFDGIKGTAAVMKYATKNKYHLSATQVQAEAEKIYNELGRFEPSTRHLSQIEIPNHMFTSYLYEELGIELSISPSEIDQIFWDSVSEIVPTNGIESLLEYLYQNHIRTGVISNICYQGDLVKSRINDLLPDNHFEFIIATSEYLFRKPNKRIFDLAIEKAELSPSDIWFAGDQYLCDIVGAKEAGMFPLWYTAAIKITSDKHEDVMEITDWNEVKKLIDECE